MESISPDQLLQIIEQKTGGLIVKKEVSLGDAVVYISPNYLLDFCKILKLDTALSFQMLVDVTVIDWLDEKDHRFEMVYHFFSLTRGYRLRLKIPISESKPEIESLCGLWSAANFLEREAWDMYGITFLNHPDLRRILMYDEFEGYPLRKDYPVQKKQPRIPLRYPEVRNTALDMQRPELVKINPKKSGKNDSGAIRGNAS